MYIPFDSETEKASMVLLSQLPKADRERIRTRDLEKKSHKTLARALAAYEKEVMAPARPKGRLLVFSSRTKIK